MGPLDYLALSHPWGNKTPFFCTSRKNIEQYKNKINIDDISFPATFRHAIFVTRELGIRYLWIDSICIIQGVDGDFEQEAGRIENVFSLAYCVLAASSAHSQHEGFLNKRKDRNCVIYSRQNQLSLFVCDAIDDFNQHVLESPLSKRGWVMQERVLAHRTIYFTNKQTYWECGEGVRCETLAKMDK